MARLRLTMHISWKNSGGTLAARRRPPMVRLMPIGPDRFCGDMRRSASLEELHDQ